MKKIKVVPLETCFNTYPGGDDPEAAKEFIKERFLERTQSRVFVHYTCAINTKNIDFVIRAVMKTILDKTLDNLGFGGNKAI